MSTKSAKAARPSSKTPARTAKKSAKSATSAKSSRSSSKKTTKTARQAAANGTRRKAMAGVAKTADKASTKSTTTKAVNEPSAQALERMIRTLSPPVQPAPIIIEEPVMSHKYQVGEMVYFTSPSFGRAAATGSYTVVKQLPSDGEDHQYRIKSPGEAFERVAKESQLDRV